MPNTLTEVLERDTHNVKVSIQALRHYGVWDLCERLPGLFEALIREVGQYLSQSPQDLLTRVEHDGRRIPAWDTILRLYMILSAHQQFVFAEGHLIRGHVSEVYGHVRRAVEGAGIAYLSQSQPDLGDIFLNGDTRTLRNRTGTGTILPRDNPLTSDLNAAVDIASARAHNNFVSFVNRTQHALSDEERRGTFRLEMFFYEAQDQQYLLRTAIWMLRTAERAARLLATSFNLPDVLWHRRLEQFGRDLNTLCQRLDPIIRI